MINHHRLLAQPKPVGYDSFMAKIKMGKWLVVEEELEWERAEATKRGQEAMAREPQAKSAYYDRPFKGSAGASP
jgi:hypothetical protein